MPSSATAPPLTTCCRAALCPRCETVSPGSRGDAYALPEASPLPMPTGAPTIDGPVYGAPPPTSTTTHSGGATEHTAASSDALPLAATHDTLLKTRRHDALREGLNIVRNRFRIDPQALPLPKLQFVTCGVRHAGLDQYDGEHLRIGLEAFVRELLREKPALQVDARVFRDPSGEFRDHNGRHPGIIAKMVASRRFPEWMANAHRELSTVLSAWGGRRAYEPIMFVLVFCRSGRHRAVAASEILKQVAEDVESFRCLPTVHLSLALDYCRCTSCVPNHPGRQSIDDESWYLSFAEAANIWRDCCAMS